MGSEASVMASVLTSASLRRQLEELDRCWQLEDVHLEVPAGAVPSCISDFVAAELGETMPVI
jgi:hypothetical protein